MNFVFVSPQFPTSYWRFCDALSRRGARVLGVGDAPYDSLLPELRRSLAEYYRVDDLEDYDQVFRAVAFFSFKYGKVDWIESNNEHWLGLDARLRDDFNVRTGPGVEQVARWRSKAAMKDLYRDAGVPSPRQVRLTNYDDTRWFIGEMGHFPVFAKPEVGVGSQGAGPLWDEDDLRALIASHGDVPYVVEQLARGDLCSWDAILDSSGEPLFENQEEFLRPLGDVARERLDMAYLSLPGVDPRLAELGRRTVRAFGLARRFVHLEFFRLAADLPGVAAAGDYVGLEVNVRPPGGDSPSMMCQAHGVDVFGIWADMVCFDGRPPAGTAAGVPPSAAGWAPGEAVCVFASRRDGNAYAHTADEVRAFAGDAVVSFGRVPAVLADDMGDEQFTARFNTREAADGFVAYVHERGACDDGDQTSERA